MSYYLDDCVNCKKRKRRKANGLCDPCDTLAKAEGTLAEIGLPDARLARLKARKAVVRRYNSLALKGYDRREIATLMGWPVLKLTSYMSQCRSDYGLSVVNLKTREANEPGRHVAKRPRNEHGGGRWGVTNCKCEPCVDRVSLTRKEIDARRDKTKRRVKKDTAALPS